MSTPDPRTEAAAKDFLRKHQATIDFNGWSDDFCERLLVEFAATEAARVRGETWREAAASHRIDDKDCEYCMEKAKQANGEWCPIAQPSEEVGRWIK